MKDTGPLDIVYDNRWNYGKDGEHRTIKFGNGVEVSVNAAGTVVSLHRPDHEVTVPSLRKRSTYALIKARFKPLFE